MAKLLRLRRGTTTQHGSFTGAEGEVTVDTDKDTLVVHDNATAGGRPMLREDLNNMPASGVTAGTYGSSSAIPSITVDAKGRVTSATTSAIDSTAITNGTSNVSVAAGGDITATRAGTQRLAVTSSGIDVTGTVTCDGIVSEVGDVTIRNATGKLILRDFADSGSASQQYISAVGADAVEDWYLGQTSSANPHVHMVNKQNGEIQFGTNDTFRHAISSDGHWIPQTTNAYDLGSNSNQFRDGYFDGTVNCDGLTSEGTITISSGDGRLDLKDNNSTGGATQNYVRGLDSNNAQKWYVGQAGSSNNNLYLLNEDSASIIFGTSGVARSFIDANGHLLPNTNNTYDLGGTNERWRNVYTNDLNLSNEGGANDVDGTWGSWTIQEGEDDLFLLNRRNGKKYKFNLSEVN